MLQPLPRLHTVHGGHDLGVRAQYVTECFRLLRRESGTFELLLKLGCPDAPAITPGDVQINIIKETEKSLGTCRQRRAGPALASGPAQKEVVRVVLKGMPAGIEEIIVRRAELRCHGQSRFFPCIGLTQQFRVPKQRPLRQKRLGLGSAFAQITADAAAQGSQPTAQGSAEGSVQHHVDKTHVFAPGRQIGQGQCIGEQRACRALHNARLGPGSDGRFQPGLAHQGSGPHATAQGQNIDRVRKAAQQHGPESRRFHARAVGSVAVGHNHFPEAPLIVIFRQDAGPRGGHVRTILHPLAIVRRRLPLIFRYSVRVTQFRHIRKRTKHVAGFPLRQIVGIIRALGLFGIQNGLLFQHAPGDGPVKGLGHMCGKVFPGGRCRHQGHFVQLPEVKWFLVCKGQLKDHFRLPLPPKARRPRRRSGQPSQGSRPARTRDRRSRDQEVMRTNRYYWTQKRLPAPVRGG